ncbi:MAG: hypothetical protein NVS9B8_14350 [Candidatus Limnocylindrales bacterium]
MTSRASWGSWAAIGSVAGTTDPIAARPAKASTAARPRTGAAHAGFGDSRGSVTREEDDMAQLSSMNLNPT